jgi:hypothetical protein
MGTNKLNLPFTLTGKARRWTFSLAAILSLGMAMPAVSGAEPSNDLVISKDGGNVNVNLNNASSSDVSIRRSDDIMVIKVPKSYKGGYSIDPALRKNSVVQEIETPTGKAITIQSQQIYLHTSDDTPSSTPQASASSDKSESKASESASKEESGPGKPGFLSISPTESTPKKGSNHTSTNRSEKHKAKTFEQRPASPLDLTRLLNQGSLFGDPMPMAQPTINHSTETKMTSNTDGQTKKGRHKDKNKSKKQATPEVTVSTPQVEITPVGDPESEPLEPDAKAQAAAIQASIGGLLRIFFSLLLVLSLIVSFVKVLLPKLIDRYPDFFDKLREHKQWSTEKPGNLFTQWPKAEPKQAPAKPSQPPVKQTESTQLAEWAQRKEPTKKSYLERLQVAGDYFQVLQTTLLGKGKELHLVELKGKQFLVATTPYTVTLLKDLSEETSPAPQSVPALFPQPEAKQIAPARTPTHTPVPPANTTQERSPVKSETIAYLSDETPIRRVSSPKPHATQPGAAQRPFRRPVTPQFPAPPNEVYQQYLPQPSIAQTPAQRSTVHQPVVHTTAVPAIQPAYVDAEEVVVLEDYDDVYRH